MTDLRLTLRSITPLLMYGADNKDDTRTNPSIEAIPELRASSMRGILRYWLRAVLGANISAVSKVYEAESAILGSTETSSRFTIRVYPSREIKESAGVTVIPAQTRGFNLRHVGFEPDSDFRIVLSTHPLDNSNVLAPDSPLVKAIFLMCHMSGLGRRARRGSGNLRVLQAEGYEGDLSLDALPEDHKALADYIRRVSEFVSPAGKNIASHPAAPTFPVFAWDTAAVLVSDQVHTNHDDAFKELWDVSGPYHQEGGIFGDVRPRRASAIHMRVSLTQSGYVAHQTILYSGSGQWRTMQKYIQHCQVNGFHDVYGTWGHWT